MASAVTALFRTRSEGQSAWAALNEEGFTPDQISYLASETGENEMATDELGPGMIAVVLPGMGALIASGPIAGAIGALGLTEASAGIPGLLRDHGVPGNDLGLYEEGVRRGGSVVIVQGISSDEATVARDILDRNGAADIEKLAGQWQSVQRR